MPMCKLAWPEPFTPSHYQMVTRYPVTLCFKVYSNPKYSLVERDEICAHLFFAYIKRKGWQMYNKIVWLFKYSLHTHFCFVCTQTRKEYISFVFRNRQKLVTSTRGREVKTIKQYYKLWATEQWWGLLQTAVKKLEKIYFYS